MSSVNQSTRDRIHDTSCAIQRVQMSMLRLALYDKNVSSFLKDDIEWCILSLKSLSTELSKPTQQDIDREFLLKPKPSIDLKQEDEKQTDTHQ